MIIYFHSTLNQIKLYEYFCYVDEQYLLKLDIARLHFGEKATFKKTTTKIYILRNCTNVMDFPTQMECEVCNNSIFAIYTFALMIC